MGGYRKLYMCNSGFYMIVAIANFQYNIYHFHPVKMSLCNTSLVPSRARANAQTPSGDNARVSWARKCDPAKILAGQSESTSCIIA